MSYLLFGVVKNNKNLHLRWSPDTYTKLVDVDKDLTLIPSDLPLYGSDTLSSQVVLNKTMKFSTSDRTFKVTVGFVDVSKSGKLNVYQQLSSGVPVILSSNKKYVLCCVIEETGKDFFQVHVKYGRFTEELKVKFSSLVYSMSIHPTSRVQVKNAAGNYKVTTGGHSFYMWTAYNTSKTIKNLGLSTVKQDNEINAQFLGSIGDGFSSVGGFFGDIFGSAWGWLKTILIWGLGLLLLLLVIYIIYKIAKSRGNKKK